MKNVKKNFNYVGIDKSVIENIRIKNIDENKFREATKSYDDSIIKVSYTKDKTLYSLKDINIKSITINIYGAKVVTKCLENGTKAEFTKAITESDIQINPLGFNIKPLKVSEYLKRLDEIFISINNIFGIEYDYSDASFKKLEINKTFTINNDFNKYKRCVDLLISNIPPNRFSNTDELKIAQWDCIKDKRKTSETILLKSKRRQLKIYDKVKQLIDISRKNKELKTVVDEIEYLNHKVMRVEYTLKNLGLVTDMSDKKIIELFNYNFKADILDSYKIWRKSNKTVLIDLINRCKTKSRYWKNELIRKCKTYEYNHRIPLLFDVEDLKEALYITEGSKRKAQRKLSQIKTIIKKDKTFNLMGNTAKLNEIFKKIQA